MEIKDFYKEYQQIDILANKPEETIRFFGQLGFSAVQKQGRGNKSITIMQLREIVVAIIKKCKNYTGVESVSLSLNVSDIDKLFAFVQSQGFKLLDDGVQSRQLGDNEEKYFTILGLNGEKIKFYEITDSFAPHKKSDRNKREDKIVLLKCIEMIREINALEISYTQYEKKKLVDKYHEIMYGKDKWEVIYFICNKLNYGMFDYIKEQYPDLDERLFKICCLSCMGLRDKDIAFLLKIKENTARKYRNDLHKRFDIPERTKIYNFIIEQYTGAR